MKRVGIGGVIYFDASVGMPRSVARPVQYLTPSWAKAIRFAALTARRLGIDFAIGSAPSSNGEAGAPWVNPADGMKKIVWTERFIIGGRRFVGKLPQPASVPGPFQDVPIQLSLPLIAHTNREMGFYYRDIAALAYRIPSNASWELHPKVTGSSGPVDAKLLFDGSYKTFVRLPAANAAHPTWIRLDFGQPRTFDGISLALQGENDMNFGFFIDAFQPQAELQTSLDGIHFRTVTVIPKSVDYQQSIAFAPTTARFYRLLLEPLRAARLPPLAAKLVPPQTEYRVAELRLATAPIIDRFEEKGAYFWDIEGVQDFEAANSSHSANALGTDYVINLSSRMRADGTLDWMAPPGRWAVLRFGYSLVGRTNRGATPEATGIEVDKLSKSRVRSYLDGYIHQFDAAFGTGRRAATFSAMESDSWETGTGNWTDDLPAQFLHRRGYDLRKWLPTLAGYAVDGREKSERFLWDFRRTLQELLVDSFYKQLAVRSHRRGAAYYTEAHELGRAVLADGMDVKRYSDAPMGAMWADNFFPQQAYDADLMESASVAHVYGAKLVAAESLTVFSTPANMYAFAPDKLNPTIDREFADGVNRIVINASAHQPLNGPGPGEALGYFSGQWFTRNETWAEEAAPWVRYISRSSFLLQQGTFVADILYFYGQDSNVTALYGKRPPPTPPGYAVDYASANALAALSVQDGQLISPGGVHYQLLALAPRARVMSLDVLRTIANLIARGAIVISDKPLRSPSLADDPAAFRALCDAVWGNGIGTHIYGRGRTVAGRSIAQVLRELHIGPDISYDGFDPKSDIRYLHRHTNDADIYFLHNLRAHPIELIARFRTFGRLPEFWHADTGVREPASYHQDGVNTLVPMSLGKNDSIFVVFVERAVDSVRSGLRLPVRTAQRRELMGPWAIQFAARDEGAFHANYPLLVSWSNSADPRIRYFSGTACYETQFEVQATERPAKLDLGDVKNIAKLFVNNQYVATLWKAPYRVDISSFLRSGRNQLKICVTNLWPNRLIGIARREAPPLTVETYNPYRADSRLLPSGLLGPIYLDP